MGDKELTGEGNKTADRRYRRRVAETVAGTTKAERRKRALEIGPDEKAEAEAAEREGKSRARK